MVRQGGTLRIDYARMDDTALVAAVRHGYRDAFREIMRLRWRRASSNC